MHIVISLLVVFSSHRLLTYCTSLPVPHVSYKRRMGRWKNTGLKHVRIVISLLFFSCLVSIELSVRGLLYIQGERLALLPRPTDEIGRCWHAHIDLIPISYSALEEEHLYLRVSGVQKRFIPQRKIYNMYFGSSFFILFLPVDIGTEVI